MSDILERTFKTKTGTCIVTPERIVLKRQGARGEMSNRIYGNNIRRTLIIYSVLGASAVIIGAWWLIKDSYVGGAFFCLIGVVLLWSTFASRNNSATASIERSTIQSVEAHPPRPLLTRGYFAVWFLENGKKRRRLIMLPGSMSGGNEEYQQALLVMRESGLLTE